MFCLLASAITQRIEETGANVQNLKTFLALAKIDKGINIKDTTQLFIFFHGGHGTNFKLFEELAALQCLRSTTTDRDIFGKACQTIGDFEVDWAKAASIKMNGASSMVGFTRGLIGHSNREIDERCCESLIDPCVCYVSSRF